MSDIYLYSVDDNPGTGLFVLSVSPDQMEAGHAGDQAFLRLRVKIKRTKEWNRRPQGVISTLRHLDGCLFLGSDYRSAGAWLLPIEDLPLTFPDNGTEFTIDLAFRFPRSFAQYIEGERAKTQSRVPLTLNIRLWGIMSVVVPEVNDVQVERVNTGLHQSYNQNIRIAFSDWVDVLLPQFGYPMRRLIELPALDRQTVPMLKPAADQLQQAYNLFAQENYREAVQRCRQVRDTLLSPDIKNWCDTNLSPVMGAEKAKMVDGMIKAFTNLGHAASHADTTVEIDRDAAGFSVFTLTLVLNYIDKKLR